MTEALLSLLKVVVVPFGLLTAARLLTHRLDDRGLFRPVPVGLVPVLAGAALGFACLRANGLSGALDPVGVWSPDSAWRVSWNELVARYLAPEVLVAGLADVAPWRDRQAALALGLVALGLTATSVRAVLVWRSREAWRGPALFAAGTVAWAAVLHAGLVLAFWTVHWLNFWLIFILLLFVELRRREGAGSKYQAS
jgi:hypothetical protein